MISSETSQCKRRKSLPNQTIKILLEMDPFNQEKNKSMYTTNYLFKKRFNILITGKLAKGLNRITSKQLKRRILFCTVIISFFLILCQILFQYASLSTRALSSSFQIGVNLFKNSKLSDSTVQIEDIFYKTPISKFRPSGQYQIGKISNNIKQISISRSTGRVNNSIVSIFTVTKDPSNKIWLLRDSILNQSLPLFQWTIINDHSVKEESMHEFNRLLKSDKRIKIVNNSFAPGLGSARRFAVSLLKENPTKYFIFIDDDDLLELTSLEKFVWLLESNSNYSIGGSHVIGFGAKNYRWYRGFHNGIRAVIHDNPLVVPNLIRYSAVVTSECKFREELNSGMEDWDFFLCMASKNIWGITIPEFLVWYNNNPEEFRKSRWPALFAENKTANEIRQRYENIEEDFPGKKLVFPNESEHINQTIPFHNELNMNNGVLLLIPWTAIGGADEANLKLVETFSNRGFRVSVICTLLKVHGDSQASRDQYLQYTHDIFFLPSFLRLADNPRFISYIIESRGIDRILICNSLLAYEILPWLKMKHENLVVVDYVHNEEKHWKNGGYAAVSKSKRKYLDLTMTSSKSAKDFMVGLGDDPKNIHVSHLGINTRKIKPFKKDRIRSIRMDLSIDENAVVICFVGRMMRVKRPHILLQAFVEILRAASCDAAVEHLHLLLVGDGDADGDLQTLLDSMPSNHLERISRIPSVNHKQALEYIGASDIFCLPSAVEGVSLATVEAMALGVVPVTSSVGGFPELITKNGFEGIRFQETGFNEKDVSSLQKALEEVICSSSQRRKMSRTSINSVRAKFNSEVNYANIVQKILTAERKPFSWNEHESQRLLQTAHSEILKEFLYFSDFTYVQKGLRMKEREGYGLEYRKICGEFEEIFTRFIDALEEPRICNGENIDIALLRSSAISQCWQTTIYDIQDPSRTRGWQYSEDCEGIISLKSKI